MNANQLKDKIHNTFSAKVVGLKDTDYEGLTGFIESIHSGIDRQTENDSKLDIVVTFSELEHVTLNESHPHLNGTSIADVILGEDEIGFYKNEEDDFSFTIEGKVVCPNCFAPLDRVKETKYEDICWVWNDELKKYNKKTNPDSDGIRCDQCDVSIEDANQFFK